MKRTIKSLAVALALLVGISACTKETPGNGNEATDKGSLEVTFGFEKETRAATSTNVVPITTWNNNIKSMTLILAQTGAGTIMDVRPISLENLNTNAQITRLFSGIVAGNYDVYIVANYDQTATPFGSGSVTPSPAVASLVGTSMSAFVLNLKAATGVVGTDVAGSTVNSEPSEIFIAKQTNINVPANSTNTLATPFKLTRAVSLMRVRIDQVYDASSNDHDNSGVNFTTAGNANFRVRLHGTGMGVNAAAYNSTTNAFPAAPYGINGVAKLSVLYSDKAFKNAAAWTAATSGYGNGADMGLSASDFTLWNEYVILPGGHATNGDLKFNIVLGGMAPIGYKALEKDAAGNTTGTKTLTAAEMVYWTAQVTGACTPNNIIELNIKLKTAGTVGPVIPPVVDYGNLQIIADLVPWGTTSYIPLPI